MRLARVVGNVVSTIKDPGLHGKKLLLVKHLNENHRPSGKAFLALDSVGAGIGETIYYVRSKEASFPFLPESVPSDATIVGIVDRIDGDPIPP